MAEWVYAVARLMQRNPWMSRVEVNPTRQEIVVRKVEGRPNTFRLEQWGALPREFDLPPET